jgi:hypothetical protein
MWFDDATGGILECGCGPWGLILGNPTRWKENIQFLARKYIIQYYYYGTEANNIHKLPTLIL